jgi:ATP-dependent DNA ligase
MQIHGPIEPMIAKSTDRIPQAGDWRFEIKLDGYRSLAKIDDRGSVQLISRRGTRLGRVCLIRAL